MSLIFVYITEEFISFEEALAAELKLTSPASSKAHRKSRCIENRGKQGTKSQVIILE